MADVKISALPARTAVATTDILPVVDAASGTPATQKATVAQVRAALVPVVLTADVSGVLPASNQAAQTLAGDVTGTTAASVISGLAVSKLAPAGTNGFVLTTTGGVPVWATPSGGYTPPTGTGFPHITSGAQDGAAVALTWTGDATGTGTGSSFALTVAKVNGASVPAAGALTTGNSLYVSGASALTYSALNLAGGSGWVTGVLPAANQAAQTMSGDVTGTTAASVVAKVKGTTITTAGGALAVGAVLRTTAVGTADWGAIDLSSSNAVSNSLPVSFGGTGAPTFSLGVLHANGTTTFTSSLIVNADVSASAAIAASKVVQATGTGFPHVTAGALDAASIKVDTTNSAHVTVPGTTDGIVTTNGSVLQQPSNVFAGSGYISVGLLANQPTAGLFRANTTPPGSGSKILVARYNATTDYPLISVNTNMRLHLGADETGTGPYPGGVDLYIASSTPQRVVANGATVPFAVTSTDVGFGVPILGGGTSADASPYSAHGGMTFAFASDINYAVTAAQYAFDWHQFNQGAWTVGHSVQYPQPATQAAGYYKTIVNNTTKSLTVTTGAGNTVIISGTAKTTQRIWFDNGGAWPAGATV